MIFRVFGQVIGNKESREKEREKRSVWPNLELYTGVTVRAFPFQSD